MNIEGNSGGALSTDEDSSDSSELVDRARTLAYPVMLKIVNRGSVDVSEDKSLNAAVANEILDVVVQDRSVIREAILTQIIMSKTSALSGEITSDDMQAEVQRITREETQKMDEDDRWIDDMVVKARERALLCLKDGVPLVY